LQLKNTVCKASLFKLQFNLVCTSAWKRPLLTSIFMIGMLLGSVAGGYLSDR